MNNTKHIILIKFSKGLPFDLNKNSILLLSEEIKLYIFEQWVVSNYVTLRYSWLKFSIVYTQATRKTHVKLDANTCYICYTYKNNEPLTLSLLYIYSPPLVIAIWYIYTGKMAHAMDVSLSSVLIYRGVIVSWLR